MSDEDDPAPRDTRLSDDEISRLPLAVQLEMKLKQERMQGNSAAFLERERRRTKIGAAFGLVAFLLTHLFVISSLLLVAAIALAGMAAGYLIVKLRWNYLLAAVLFGGVSIAGTMIALLTGAMRSPDLIFMIAVWGVLGGLAAVLVNMVESDRQRKETF